MSVYHVSENEIWLINQYVTRYLRPPPSTNKINDLQKSGFMKNMKAAFVLCNSCVIVSRKISLSVTK